MNDRFQFRVWKGKENRMVYNVTHLNPLLLDERINPENKHNVPMQCTGLKDKNGTLIYEGDILKAIYTTPHGKIIEKVCEVEFKRCAFWVRDGIGAFYLDNENCVYEVTGNIYENADLLQECE